MADSDPDALPGTQSAHEVGAVSNVLRPLEHFSHFDFAASAAYVPPRQTVQAASLTFFAMYPAGHSLHTKLSRSSAK